jgi:hypothetical protein
MWKYVNGSAQNPGSDGNVTVERQAAVFDPTKQIPNFVICCYFLSII